MKLFAIPNLSASKTFETSLPVKLNRPQFKTKEQFIKWSQDQKTKFAYFSGYEGLTPSLRVNDSNPALYMRALVLDYDCGGPGASTWEDMVAEVKAHKKPKPRYMMRSFSGGARLIWPLTEPVLVHTNVWKATMKELVSILHADKLLDSLDKGYTDTYTYYASGDSWIDLGSPDLQANSLYTSILKSSAKVTWKHSGVSIPIEVVRDALNSKFPSRWQGEFDLGARGCRFWDETADNPTAAIVRETGMQCFTGPQPFVSWAQIFGSKFVSEYTDQRIGGALKDEVYFDGTTYWKKLPDGWYPFNRLDIALHLKLAGLSADTDGDGISEIDKALGMIQTDHRVSVTGPLFHQPQGVRLVGGKKFLNTSQVKLIKPADKPKEWGEGFPKLAEFFDGWFEPVGGEDPQLLHFMAWVQRFYKSCVALNPLPGQAIFVAGEIEQGKTFMSTRILGSLFGSFSDASQYVLKETGFNGSLCASPLWTIDDTSPGETNKHTVYSSMIKSIAANPYLTLNEKFQKTVQIPWKGRIIVTCNLDNESLRIIPSLDQSLMDKIMLFKLSIRDTIDFPALDAALDHELPNFARWLTNWDAAAEGVLEFSRYGVTSYHHPHLVRSAREVAPASTFRDLLVMHFRGIFSDQKVKDWTGNATELLGEMGEDMKLRMMLQAYKPVFVGRLLGQLESQGFYLEQVNIDHRRQWKFTRKFLEVPDDAVTSQVHIKKSPDQS